MSEWIAITTDTPKWGDWVWVVIGGVTQRMAAQLSRNYHGQPVWDWADLDADSAPFEVVTHWQPLPEPPNAERKTAPVGPCGEKDGEPI